MKLCCNLSSTFPYLLAKALAAIGPIQTQFDFEQHNPQHCILSWLPPVTIIL